MERIKVTVVFIITNLMTIRVLGAQRNKKMNIQGRIWHDPDVIMIKISKILMNAQRNKGIYCQLTFNESRLLFLMLKFL